MYCNPCLVTAEYKVVWISNFHFSECVISVIGKKMLSKVSYELHATIWRTDEITILDMGTSFVNRYFDDLEICFNLSTILASFPGTGFNFS